MKTIETAVASFGPSAEKYAFPLEQAMIKGGIIAPLEKAHFLAQVFHESGGFTRVEENLNYSAKRLREVFGKYFPNDTLAKEYEHNPARIGNRVYALRGGNGNEASGDGYAYRGRGLIQLTFKENYWQASKAIFGDNSLLTSPSMVASDPNVSAEVAVWYWNSRDCCGPSRRDDCRAVTVKVNGGTNGLEERKKLTDRFKQLFLEG